MENSLILKDEDVGNLRSDNNPPHHIVLDKKLDPDFYLRGNPTRQKLVDLCTSRNIKTTTHHRRKGSAKLLCDDYKRKLKSNIDDTEDDGDDESQSESDSSDSGDGMTRDKEYYRQHYPKKCDLQNQCQLL